MDSGSPGVAGKVAVVTGATSGVGRGVALEWARRGATVVATGRREQLGAELEAQARQAGGELVFVRADVTSETDSARVASLAVERFGRIDVLVANAGIVGTPATASVHEAGLDWWQDILATNLTGVFLSIRSVLPAMLSQNGGHIITIASMNAQVPLSRMAAYNASKAGVVQLTRTVALEYQMAGIRANTVILGGVEGDTNTAVRESMLDYVHGGRATDEQRAAGAAAAAAFNQPAEHVGAALAMLAADDAGLISGAVIPMDRGLAAGALTDLAITLTTSGYWPMPGMPS